MKIRNNLLELQFKTIAATFAALGILGGLYACGENPAPAVSAPGAPVTAPAPALPAQCDLAALAAVDLSGECRAIPATMGALEAQKTI